MRSIARLFLLSMVVLFASFAFAGDCSGPDDCAAPPDNGSKAAACGGVICGWYLYKRSRKPDDDSSEGEGEVDDQQVLFGDAGTDAEPKPPAEPPKEEPKAPKKDILNQPLGGDDDKVF